MQPRSRSYTDWLERYHSMLQLRTVIVTGAVDTTALSVLPFAVLARALVAASQHEPQPVHP